MLIRSESPNFAQIKCGMGPQSWVEISVEVCRKWFICYFRSRNLVSRVGHETLET